MKIIIFLVSFLLCVIAQKDSECQDGFKCVPVIGCFHYKKQQDRLKQLSKGSSEFKAIRKELASLVCNKRERKICCDTTESPSWVPKPDENECGLKGDNAEFIVGGKDAKPGQFPWTVLLGSYNEDTKTIDFTCGGTLINKW